MPRERLEKIAPDYAEVTRFHGLPVWQSREGEGYWNPEQGEV